jgi:RNA polymerase sigma-70 factor (ECF subfamily)
MRAVEKGGFVTALQQDEDRLVADVRAGGEGAFGDLATAVRPWLVATCTRHLGGDRHQAEDIAQECLVKLDSALRRDARPLRVRAWLSVVARNACIDHIRRSLPEPVDAVPDTAVPDDDPFELDPALERAWANLSPRHREALQLRELVGLSYDETALAMGITLGSVETLLFRARGALRREYQRAGGRLLGCGAFVFALDRLTRGGEGGPDVTTHLASCGRCQEAVTAADRLTGLLRGVPIPDLSVTALHSVADAASRWWHRLSSVLSVADPSQVAAALTAGAVAVAPLAVPASAPAPTHRPASHSASSTGVTVVKLSPHLPVAAGRPVPSGTGAARGVGPASVTPVGPSTPTPTPSPSSWQGWQPLWPEPSRSPHPESTHEPSLLEPFPRSSAGAGPTPVPFGFLWRHR